MMDEHITTKLLEGIPKLITKEENKRLIKEITNQDISVAIKSMELDNLLGHDGFSIHFY